MPIHAREGSCRFDGKPLTYKLPSNFLLRLTPINSRSGEGCRAKLIDSNKKVVFSVADWDLRLVLSGKDVNGDGNTDIVLEGYGGGAHCCWTYYIVSLGPSPGRLFEFYNERGAKIVNNPADGRMEILTMDGAFDYFDFLSHAETPFPDVYLRLDGKSLIDVGSQHVAEYDRSLKHAKAKLDAKLLQEFKSASDRDALAGPESNRRTASIVLQIIFDYLYSGREDQARGIVKKMWPLFDQDRIWKLILKTRRKGILRYTELPQG